MPITGSVCLRSIRAISHKVDLSNGKWVIKWCTYKKKTPSHVKMPNLELIEKRFYN